MTKFNDSYNKYTTQELVNYLIETTSEARVRSVLNIAFNTLKKIQLGVLPKGKNEVDLRNTLLENFEDALAYIDCEIPIKNQIIELTNVLFKYYYKSTLSKITGICDTHLIRISKGLDHAKYSLDKLLVLKEVYNSTNIKDEDIIPYIPHEFKQLTLSNKTVSDLEFETHPKFKEYSSEEIEEKIPQYLDYLYTDKKIKGTQIARKLGISNTAFHEHKRGKRKNANNKMLNKIIITFEDELKDLFNS